MPAALNGVIGFKPSRGLISSVGLVPACKSLDCITMMASCIDDVDRVFDVMAARDDADAWSRDRGPRYTGTALTVGLPALEELEFFGDEPMQKAHLAFRERLAGHVNTVEVSLQPFLAAFTRELPAYDVRSQVASIEIPVLLLVGSRDRYLDDMTRLNGLLPDSRMFILQDCGHMPFYEEPGKFQTIALDFLS